MVALLVRLKLTLLRNSLKRSVWRTVGLVIGMLYGLAVVAGVIAGLIALRWGSLTLTADITVTAYAALTLGWLLMSLLVFGVDETVDPARFALLPVRARELLPGLLVCGLVGVPGAATVLISLGLIVTWARSVPLDPGRGDRRRTRAGHLCAAVAGGDVGVRRVPGLPAVPRSGADCAGPGRAGSGVAGNLIGTLIGPEASRFREGLAAIATIAGWTRSAGRGPSRPTSPAGLAGRRRPPGPGRRTGRRRLVGLGPFPGRSADLADRGRLSSAKVTNRRAAVSGFRATPAGGVAVRDLKYWRRDRATWPGSPASWSPR